MEDSAKKAQKEPEDDDSQSRSTCTGGSGTSVAAASSVSSSAMGALVLARQNKQPQDGRFKRIKCEKTHQVAEMCSARYGCCVRCHNAYRSLTNRWGTCRKLRQWWTGLTKEQQVAWFVKQQDVPAGVKRKFDQLCYAGHDVNTSYRTNEDVDRFVPWHVFRREGVASGRCEAELEKEFQDMVDDPNVECIHRRGQWLVPFFEGVFRRTGEGHTTETWAFRQTTVQSSEHLSQLHHQGNCLHDQFVESCVPTKTSLVYENSGWVQGQVSDQPVLPDTQGVISRAIAREACLSDSQTEPRLGFPRFALPGLSELCAAQPKPKQTNADYPSAASPFPWQRA